MNSAKMKRPRVAMLIESSRSYGRALLRGIGHFARTQGNWSILHEEMTIADQLPEWFRHSELSGVIARVDSHTVAPLRQLNVPIVDVLGRRNFEAIPRVDTDNHAVASAAFEHLWERGFRRFAFCGFQSAHYSEARAQAFTKLVHASGCPCSVYESPADSSQTVAAIERAGLRDEAGLSSWLESFTPPVGLFACNDIRGQHVLRACASLDRSVPDDVGVIGVDNDHAICKLTDPPMSSILTNAEQVGFRAAEILQQMLAGRHHAETMEYVAPIGIIQRFSTQVTATEDREIARICQYIREHACDGICVSDAAAFSSLSRRQIERRFRDKLCRTVRQEITSVQLDKAKCLLRETTMPLDEIAPLAGYMHRERLSQVFKRETGQTPGAYRREHAFDSQSPPHS